MKYIRLGVNVDHVATVREARKTYEPDPVAAAVLAELGGADGITVHLRMDRRHIKERDLKLLKEVVKTRLNLEMATTDEMLKIALTVKPHQVTLVPEREGEITTEGGLDVESNLDKVSKVIEALKREGIEVSIFVDPEPVQIKASKRAGADAIEIHTGIYAEARGEKRIGEELSRIFESANLAKNLGLKVHAGHGLNYKNIIPVLKTPGLEEVNIGHSIVARAVLVGMERAVREMKEVIDAFS
ncbi:MAG: pyridoxine 5'-phosphate synthase [Deferribacteres bacterium]|nr:pyridoxine 5'-phosphate synthase [Deferribacteres bacterium]